MEKTKIAIATHHPERKHRHVFTQTYGLFFKKKRVCLDIDEHGVTVRASPYSGTSFSAMYLAMESIHIDERELTVAFKLKDFLKPFTVNVLDLDGDAWTNFVTIKNILKEFAPNKLS